LQAFNVAVWRAFRKEVNIATTTFFPRNPTSSAKKVAGVTGMHLTLETRLPIAFNGGHVSVTDQWKIENGKSGSCINA
jgi:hypothetical protein